MIPAIPAAIPFPEVDPALFTLEIAGIELALRWYALAYIVGLVVGWRLMVALMKRPTLWPGNRAPMTPEQPEELLTWMVLGVVLGGRFGFVLFYNPGYYLLHPLEILQVWQGGMSFHGGFIGVILGTYFYTRAKGIPLLQAGDAVALATPFGLMLGRLANFINGELWGRPTDVSWGMVFPSVAEIGAYYPQLLPGGENVPRHPSQLYEAALEGAVLLGVLWWLALARGWLKTPGAVTGVFFIGYGAARTFVENFRQGNTEFITPDNPYGQFWRFGSGPDAYGLTMGQILSLPMIAIGLAFLAFAFQRRTRDAG
ncbi:prolipoprotein diacylglyceryl transferase [Rhodobacteraceae bacterium NNCM2]|nr:prolipoprotein diacylglyceryl transferase [Coraliihabitans acroporae]